MKIKTLVITFVTALMLMPFVGTAQERIEFTPYTDLPAEAYIYRDTCNRVDGRLHGVSPVFLIYPDKACDEVRAAELVDELGMDTYLHEYFASVVVMNPVGTEYYADKDFEAYKAFLNKWYVISNMKVIGIGDGATFVNDVVAKHAGAIAGIATIGGKPSKVVGGIAPVPVFIAGDSAKRVAASYILQNDAEESESADGLTFYTNLNEPLQRVVVSQKKYPSLRETFADAWEHIFSKNYRINNFQHTWYTGCHFEEYGPYELEPYIMPENMGIVRNVVVKNLLGTGDFLWYEYHPKATLDADEGTVPLVLLLHGHTNDPRTQAETSGFVELAAKENFMVAELEWQGNGYAPMGLDGIEQVVYHLLATYPQLDATRVYAEGLSAGSATATALGIRKSYIFAAVGAQSAGIFQGEYLFGCGGDALQNEAVQKRGWVEMPYFSVTGRADEVVPFVTKDNWETNSIFAAWRAYQTMNNLEITAEPDFGKDEVFGVELADRETIMTNKHISMETGTLYKGDMPLIRMVAINEYGHWNFKPDAQLMWDYFTHFSRDVETKKLIYNE